MTDQPAVGPLGAEDEDRVETLGPAAEGGADVVRGEELQDAIERVDRWANYAYTYADTIAVDSPLSTFTAGDLRLILAALRPQPTAPAGEVTHRQASAHAETATNPLTTMLREVDGRLNRDNPDIPGARAALHGARLAAAYMELSTTPAPALSVDLGELKRLAEAVNIPDFSLDPHDLKAHHEHGEKVGAFCRAANPSVVLALIAQIERGEG